MLIKKTKIPFMQIATIGILPSFIKKFIYRLKGYKIGKNVSIGLGSIIVGKQVSIGDNVKIGLVSVVRAREIDIRRYVVIGSFSIIDSGSIMLDEDSRINEKVIVGGMKRPESALILGKRGIIMEYAFINTTMPVTIGDDSGIGGHCLLFTHGSWLNQLEGFPVTFAPITIGKSVWLPWRVFIMPGVTIGDKVVVGANSLINRSIPSNTMIAGSPAKILRENYPVPISDTEKLSIFASYLSEFVDFLRYNNIDAQLKIDDQRTIIIVKTKKVQTLVAQFLGKEKVYSGTSGVYVTNICNRQQQLPEKPIKNLLILDVSSKQRLGTSALGEEFVKFLSRYGLRFNRLD